MNVFTPLLQEPRGELEGAHLRLAKCGRHHVFARNGFEHGLQRSSQSAHSDSGVVVGRSPDHVIVGEVYGRAFIKRLRTSAKASFLRHEKIQDDLLVSSPITAVSEDEDSFNLHLSEVALPRMLLLVFCKLPKWSGVNIVLNDVSRCAMVFTELVKHIHETPNVSPCQKPVVFSVLLKDDSYPYWEYAER